MPCLSIRSRFLLLAAAVLLFGLDTAIYAEGLSGLKDSLNKGKINKNEVEATPNGRPDIVSEPAAVEVPAKIKRITESNSNTKFVFINKKQARNKSKSTKNIKYDTKQFGTELKQNLNMTLASLKKAPKKAKLSQIVAVRIGSKDDTSVPPELPEWFLTNIDTAELAIRTEVKNLLDSFEVMTLRQVDDACMNLNIKYCTTRPDICALVRLIKNDAQLKKDYYSALERQTYRKLSWSSSPYPSYNPSIYEEYLKMGRDTEFGNDIIKFVNKTVKTRQSQIKKSNDDILLTVRKEIDSLTKLKANYEAYIKKMLASKYILPGSTSQYENNSDNLQAAMEDEISNIKSYYYKISQKYMTIATDLNRTGEWKESLELTKEFKDYFEKQCPYKFTIKYAGYKEYSEAANSGNVGNLKFAEGDLLIDKDSLIWGTKRVDQAFLECASRLSLQSVSDEEKSIQFRDEIIKFADSNITDQEEIKKYKQEATVTKIYFTENEYFDYPIDDKIFAAGERICIRYKADGYNSFYRKPVEVKLKSSISNREKVITIYSSGYAVFQPNEDAVSNDKAKNLIKRHGKNDDELKHSVCIADGLLKYLQDNWDGDDDSIKPNPLKTIKESKLFKNYLGEGVVTIKDNEPVNRLKINENFLNTMGFEVLSAKLNSINANNIEKNIYIENHADWFIMQSHGNTDHAALVIDDGNDPQFKVNAWAPEQLKIDNNNLSFFILSACSILSVESYWLSPNTNVIGFAKSNGKDGVNDGIRWRKKMGEKVVLLGYSSEVTYYIMSNSIFKLITHLESYPALQYPYEDELKKFIINCWLEMHKNYSEKAYKNLIPYMTQDGLHYTIVYGMETIKGTEAACAIYKNIYYWLETKQNILDDTNENDPNAFFTKITELDITNGL